VATMVANAGVPTSIPTVANPLANRRPRRELSCGRRHASRARRMNLTSASLVKALHPIPR
jgi:hypothetical protein